MTRLFYIITVTISLLGFLNAANAQDVRITKEMLAFDIEINGKRIIIERNQDQNAVIPDAFARTSRVCSPFCIHPMSAGEGVETVGELEVLAFLNDVVATGNGFLVDARAANLFHEGTIPGSISLPFNLFENPETNPFIEAIFTQLGGVLAVDGRWDFAQAKSLMLFCNGPWCDQSPQAINNLMSVGYPTEKLFYYRGGLQNWLMMGLTTTEQ